MKGGDNLKQRYVCYLNGKLYGMGDLEYMNELFKDYVVACQMHGNETVTFKIVDREQAKCKKCGSFETEITTLRTDYGHIYLQSRNCLKCDFIEELANNLTHTDKG